MIATVDYRQLAEDFQRLHSERCADLLASESENEHLKNTIQDCHEAYRKLKDRRSFWCWLRSWAGGEA